MRRWLLPWLLARRFDPAAAAGLTVTLELAVGGDRYALEIADGRCRVRRGAAPAPAARAGLAWRDLTALARGATDWGQLFSAGRITLSGDPFLALRLPALFQLTPSAKSQLGS